MLYSPVDNIAKIHAMSLKYCMLSCNTPFVSSNFSKSDVAPKPPLLSITPSDTKIPDNILSSEVIARNTDFSEYYI